MRYSRIGLPRTDRSHGKGWMATPTPLSVAASATGTTLACPVSPSRSVVSLSGYDAAAPFAGLAGSPPDAVQRLPAEIEPEVLVEPAEHLRQVRLLRPLDAVAKTPKRLSPSPRGRTTAPPWRATRSSISESWRASASRMASRSRSHRRVLPSTSVNRNVTAPIGRADVRSTE